MASLSGEQLLHLLLALGITLIAARGVGELARRCALPEVLGQLIAGVALGPSLLGPLLPGVYDALFGDPPAANGLSAISWLGAILIFLSAGTEADLRVLRRRARPGLSVSLAAIVSSIVVGTLVGWLLLAQEPIAGVYLGVTLSVTAVSVLVAILDERGAMRRDYGQVLLAAGVVTEMAVWVFIPVVTSLLSGHPAPWVAGAVAVAGVAGVFLFVLSVGQLAVHAALRWVADRAIIVRSPVSVILAVTLLAAALSEALGLHPLLGAFAAGMILVRAPRVRPPLMQSVQTLTTGFLAPLFFAFAGARINLRELGGWDGVLDVLLLLVAASAVKIGAGFVAGRLSGMRVPDARIAAIGMNLKGGTDVIVALIGTELGFFSSRLYSIYGAVAVLTVLLSAPVLARLDRANPPSTEEQQRLDRETALEGGYLAGLERVALLSSTTAGSLLSDVLDAIGATRRRQGLAFDVVAANPDTHLAMGTSTDIMAAAVPAGGFPSTSTSLPIPGGTGLPADLVVTCGELAPGLAPRTVLVPFDGRPPAFAAVDVALCLAERFDAQVVPVRVRPERAGETAADRDTAARGLDELLARRISATDVATVQSSVVSAPDVARALLAEVERTGAGLVVMGSTAHSGMLQARFGRTIDAVMADERVPVVLVVTR